MTGRTLLVDLELHRDLVPQGRDAEGDLELHLDVLSTLGTPAARALIAGRAAAEHRAENVAEPTEPADVEILESEVAAAGCTSPPSRPRPCTRTSTTEAAKCTELSHLIVLLAPVRVPENL